MNAEETERPRADAGSNQSVLEDLRLRLYGSQRQVEAARAEARLLARELAIARRLLTFSAHSKPMARPVAPPRPTNHSSPRVCATLLSRTLLFHLDSCRDAGSHVALAGWAFLPSPAWDARIAAVTVVFRHGAEAYAVNAGKAARPDVAAHFAAQNADVAGGAHGLASAGFACEIVRDSLPSGVDLDIALRLECTGLACERSTGQLLRL